MIGEYWNEQKLRVPLTNLSVLSCRLKFVKGHIFRGPEYERSLNPNQDLFKVDEYFKIGQLISFLLIQADIGPQFFSETLYKCLTADDPYQIWVMTHDRKCLQLRPSVVGLFLLFLT